ncbi:MAG: viroplasmin family protein [Bdellovibrionales bacterium]|nr:viroplasmin family protein [Bdellovibrionales bacterium]
MVIWIFADGACSGNPGPGGWAAVLCAFAPNKDQSQVLELVGAAPATTNNRMEMTAVLEALRAARTLVAAKTPVTVFSDSKLVLQGITQWRFGWKKRGWKKADGEEVMNRDLWEELDAELATFPAPLEWHHVPGHSGVEGNERVDELAVAACKGQSPALYRGALADYVARGMFAQAPAEARDARTLTSGSSGGGPAIPKGPATYLSYVGGRLERHSTWAECEKRVKGVAGAKFKKVSSATEEGQTLMAWGLAKK